MATTEPDKKPARRLRVGEPLTLRQEIEKQHTAEDDSKVAAKKTKAGQAVRRHKLGKPFVWTGRQLHKLVRPFRFMRRPWRIIKKALGFGYFISSWQELRQVTWPNRRQTWQLTSAVIIFAVIFGLLLAGVDHGLDKIFKYILTN